MDRFASFCSGGKEERGSENGNGNMTLPQLRQLLRSQGKDV